MSKDIEHEQGETYTRQHRHVHAACTLMHGGKDKIGDEDGHGTDRQTTGRQFYVHRLGPEASNIITNHHTSVPRE